MHGYTLGDRARNEESRKAKATKIIAVVERHTELAGKRVLDIGTGAGYIAHELSLRAGSVCSIDVTDDRLITEGFAHKIVTDERIPYDDSSFDIVVSNQVIEHVADARLHLAEIRRVLADDGWVYLASPNKWWISDPHYHLPFIAWLPRPVAVWYLRVVKRRLWDIHSLSLRQLERLVQEQGFTLTDEAWRVICDPGRYGMSIPGPVRAVAARTPRPVVRLLLHLLPSHIKSLRPTAA